MLLLFDPLTCACCTVHCTVSVRGVVKLMLKCWNLHELHANRLSLHSYRDGFHKNPTPLRRCTSPDH